MIISEVISIFRYSYCPLLITISISSKYLGKSLPFLVNITFNLVITMKLRETQSRFFIWQQIFRRWRFHSCRPNAMAFFKTLGADLVGTSDNCVCVDKADTKAAGDLLTFLLPGEIPYIILKSKVKEYIFTDLAFIFIERDNVMGTKRLATRYPYFSCGLTNVQFETAGEHCTSIYHPSLFKLSCPQVMV